MKRAFCIILLLGAALSAAGQRLSDLLDLSSRNRFAWEYDADLLYFLDNRSFDASDGAYTPSGALHSVVFTPTAGFSIQQNRRVNHRLTVGAEIAHDMGQRSWRTLLREPVIYYDAHVRTRNGGFEGLAGVFPRRFLEGSYSEAFFSDSTRLSDRNLEGALVKWRSERFFAELGLDWAGPQGPARRERIQLMTAGDWNATTWLSLGWTGSFVRLGESQAARGVVDYFLAEPWIKADFSRRTRWQEISLQAGLMAGAQLDYVMEEAPEYQTGCEIVLTARRYSLSLQNSCYFGDNLMPLYGRPDVTGHEYGHQLFFSNPFYRSTFYDRLECAWEPRITPYLNLRIAARFHFHQTGLVGWQQQLGLHFNLDALRNRDLPAGRCL